MNRTLLFSFRKPIIGIPGYTYTLYDVYYYYDGGYVGFDRQDLQRALTPAEAGSYPDQSAIVGTYSTVALCIDSFLTRFKAIAPSPYGQIETTTTPCGVVCDAAITNWAVTDATTAEANDGEILVTASTSHGPLEYRLDNGPVTDYQDSNLFTGLDGDKIYYLRVRDAAGCIATQAVHVGITPAVYGEKYRIEYTDRLGRATRISIEAKNYTGEVIEKCGLVPATKIGWQGQGEGKYKEIHASEVTVGTLSATNFELLGLFSSDDRQHRVTIRKGNDYVTMAIFWQGWILPDYYTEQYVKSTNYQVTIKASDAIGDLRNHYFLSPAKQPIFERWTQLAILQFCLAKTGLSLPLYTGLNTFESRLAHGDDDDVLNLTYLDTAGFYTYSDDADPEPFSLLDVLTHIVNKHDCRLYQGGGAWHIVSVDEAGGAYRRRLFDAAGAFVSSDTPNNVRPLGAHSTNTADVLWVNKQQNLEMLPACKIITLLQDYGLKNNLIPDGFFTPDAFLDETHLRQWSGTAVVQSANRQSDFFVGNSPVYGGSQGNYVPPKGSSGNVIKKTVAKKQINGVDILGSYMDLSSLTRVTLFISYADERSVIHMYYELATGRIYSPLEQIPNSSDYAALPLGIFSAFSYCDDGFVVKFRTVADYPFAEKVLTTDPCPITAVEKTYLDSTGVLLHQNASHWLRIKLDYQVVARTEVRGSGLSDPAAIAALFRIRIEIKLEAYYLIGSEWSLTPGYTEIQPQTINKDETYEVDTFALPITGELTVRIYQLIFTNEKPYRNANTVRLRVNSMDADLLIDEQYPPTDQLLSCPISEKFNEVPDQVEVTHGDLPEHNNAEVIYRGGIYVNAPPVGMAYTGWEGRAPVGLSLTQTVFLGTGSNGDTQLFLTGNYAYFVRDGDTLDDKEGPFLIVGTVTATGDLVLLRTFFPISDGIGLHPGRVYRAEEVANGVLQPSLLWQRYHADNTVNGATSQLLRILLQNQALNFSKPSQVLRGTIKGRFAFGQCISDPANNPGKVFLVTGAELDDEACRWTGEWVEIISGDPGGFETNPPPEEQLEGTRVWEDGGFRDWEDGAWAEWENYQE